MKYYIIFVVLLASLWIIFSCSNEKDKKILDFNDYSFDTTLNGEGMYNIGYEFNISGKYYANRNYNFIYYAENVSEKRILIPDIFSNNEVPIYWRETILPFRIIKKANSDTLIIIKNGKEFIFKRIKNSKP